MNLEITVRSSGHGPRKMLGVPLEANAHHRKVLLGHALRMIAGMWPKDGVAITIRRTS